MNEAPTLRTLRLTLRPWRESDIGPLTTILSDPQVTRYLFGDGEPLTERDARDAYGRRVASWENDGLGFWAIELQNTGELVGWAGLQVSRFEKGLEGAVEIGWTLGRTWWGNGYALEAAEASLRWAFEERDIEKVHAFYAPANRRSERVMEALGMQPAGRTTDVRDGCVSNVRAISRGEWLARHARSAIPNPHRSPAQLARVLGYDVDESWSAFTSLDAEGLRAALLAAIGRTWPGGELPGEPRAYDVADEATDVATAMTADRLAGLVPLLVTTEIDEAEECCERLEELYVTTLREGVWLHVDVAARHGMHLDGLARADSIAFDVPSNEGFVRVFVTRHPGMLDAAFAEALAYKGPDSGIG